MRRRGSKGRLVHGILPIDKPEGFTSNQVLQKVKRLFGAEKAGHTGSLDPLATGVLPICFGDGTKMCQYLLNSDKNYEATVQLGVKTASGDSEGEVVSKLPVDVSRNELETVLHQFRGAIRQIPSMFSALKHNGQPLYKFARQGIEIERLPRNIIIHRLALTSFNGKSFTIEVDCSKGTYIRTLAEDIGEMLVCGAHISALRRLVVGPYNIHSSYTLGYLEAIKLEGGYEALDHLLQGLDTAVMHWPAVQLGESSSCYLLQGQPVMVPKAPSTGWVRLYGYNAGSQAQTAQFIGIGEITDDGLVAPKRLMTSV